MITITNFPRGARGLRVVWLCEEMGLPYRLEKIGYPVPDSYRAKNPLGSVPFLEDGDVAINESVAQLLYIASRYGPTPLLPAASDPRFARVLQMVVFSEATFGAGTNTLMAAHFGAPDADKQNWSVRMQEQASLQALAFIEAKLAGADHLAGDFSLADIAISTSLGVYKGALQKPLTPALDAYRDRLSQRPAYKRALAANTQT
ncbi:MAG: glutathione S-transferase family protein [Hydrogenophilaceae bacterium]|jgi:glutathione S-transferase|nr:glutathione S-transferase family protein [Hydrogenophilaceae bacterium]